MRFGIFIYDGVEPIDLATYGVLSMARRLRPEIEMCSITRTMQHPNAPLAPIGIFR
jgi:hypothetical protein